MIKEMSGKRKSVFVPIFALFAAIVTARIITENRFDEDIGSDPIEVTRCDILCYDIYDVECHELCMRAPFVKHGRCPDSFEDLSPFVQACVEFCLKDNDCPSTEKCCEHSCGYTCKPAIGLHDEKYLPPVPENVTASEERGTTVSWTVPYANVHDTIFFVLEERHHVGAYFNHHLLGEWNPIYSTRNTSVVLKNILKPGYYYQFRVASVNINGSRGYSAFSEGFTVGKPPKIQKPKNLRVEDVKERNGTIWGMLRWKSSRSSIPIDKYKIVWSFKLDDDVFKYNSDSVFTQRITIPEENDGFSVFIKVSNNFQHNSKQQYYQLKHLLKNKTYYIQVQALANYGQETLKSNKAHMIFDTSVFQNQYENMETAG